MIKFEYSGKWYQELDPKCISLYDRVECLVKDYPEDKWELNKLLACVSASTLYNFIVDTGACYQQCAIPCDPPESRLMTNRELAELLAKGYGEYMHGIIDSAFATRCYSKGKENEIVSETERIRSWGSTEWIKPTIDIYNKFLNKDHQ